MQIASSQLDTVLLLDPENFTDQMWGGDWIAKLKGLKARKGSIGESWEFSARSERPVKVRMPNGKSMSILDLIDQQPDKILGPHFLGRHGKTVPLLVKFIDARDDLSFQVHPSDADVAGTKDECGKSEAWYILESGTGNGEGHIYIGFNPDKAAAYTDRAMFETAFFDALNQANSMGPSGDPAVRAKGENLIVPFVNKIRVRAGEIYELRPGTIHATGRGVRIFEVQQSSDTTYRVWDWNRPDAAKLKKGKREFRDLHLEKARRVLNFRACPSDEFRLAPMLVQLPGAHKVREECLVVDREKKFAANRLVFEKPGAETTLSTRGQFQILTAVRGQVGIGKEGEIVLKQGHSALVPACVSSVVIKSATPSEVIRSYVPI